jgi:hypothetical protein
MMGFSIKEFNDLHKDAKSIIIGIALIMPVWFMDIFLFHRTFFNSNQLYIIIVISYCISIAWLGINYLMQLVVNFAFESKDDNVMVSSILVSLFILLVFSCYAYIEHMTFLEMMLDVFLSIISIITLSLLIIIIKWLPKKLRHSKKIQSTINTK